MSASAETLLRQALQLPPNDSAALVEGLITSLDKSLTLNSTPYG